MALYRDKGLNARIAFNAMSDYGGWRAPGNRHAQRVRLPR